MRVMRVIDGMFHTTCEKCQRQKIYMGRNIPVIARITRAAGALRSSRSSSIATITAETQQYVRHCFLGSSGERFCRGYSRLVPSPEIDFSAGCPCVSGVQCPVFIRR